MRKFKVEFYLRYKINSYSLHESMSLKKIVCVPTFGQIRRDLRETRTKCYFGTSKKYSFLLHLFSQIYTVLVILQGN